MKTVVSILLAALMLLGAVNHVLKPDFYAPMIPSFIPVSLANWLATFVEAAIGIALLVPRWRTWGGLGFFALMLAFMPIHVWDLFRDEPAMGSFNAALIRFFLQFLLIYGGWWVHRKYKPSANEG